jgi:hypothetical protein
MRDCGRPHTSTIRSDNAITCRKKQQKGKHMVATRCVVTQMSRGCDCICV